MTKEGLFLCMISLFLNQVISSLAFCENVNEACELTGGTIAGIVIGCLIAILIILVAVLLACSHARMSTDEDFFIDADPVVDPVMVSQNPNGSTRISIPHPPRYSSSNRTRGPDRNSDDQSLQTPNTVQTTDRTVNNSNANRIRGNGPNTNSVSQSPQTPNTVQTIDNSVNTSYASRTRAGQPNGNSDSQPPTPNTVINIDSPVNNSNTEKAELGSEERAI